LSRLAKTNPSAKQTDKMLDEIVAQETVLKQKYRQLLYELFALIYGKTELTFTSEDLLRVGFDDGKEPDLSDYDDYL